LIYNRLLLGFDPMVILKVTLFFKEYKRDTNEASRITHLVLLIKHNKEVFGSLAGLGLLLFRVVGPRHFSKKKKKKKKKKVVRAMGQLLTIVLSLKRFKLGVI
jgi:hypothetical protein